MDFLTIFFVFIFGSIVGSFLNVVILRYNTGRSIIVGRSSCPVCSTELSWWNMVPIVSFLFQGGKCSSCFAKVSWQYPIVEFLAAVLFALLYLKSGLTYDFVFYALIFSILIVIAVYDIRHKIIPDAFVYLLIFISFLRLSYIYLYVSPDAAMSSFWGGAASFLFLGSFWLMSDGRWMGLGDAKLALSLGWLETLCYGATALIYSFWLGAAIGILINLLFKKIREVPFAPFLIAGFLIVFFSNSNLFSYLGDLVCIR